MRIVSFRGIDRLNQVIWKDLENLGNGRYSGAQQQEESDWVSKRIESDGRRIETRPKPGNSSNLMREREKFV